MSRDDRFANLGLRDDTDLAVGDVSIKPNDNVAVLFHADAQKRLGVVQVKEHYWVAYGSVVKLAVSVGQKLKPAQQVSMSDPKAVIRLRWFKELQGSKHGSRIKGRKKRRKQQYAEGNATDAHWAGPPQRQQRSMTTSSSRNVGRDGTSRSDPPRFVMPVLNIEGFNYDIAVHDSVITPVRMLPSSDGQHFTLHPDDLEYVQNHVGKCNAALLENARKRGRVELEGRDYAPIQEDPASRFVRRGRPGS